MASSVNKWVWVGNGFIVGGLVTLLAAAYLWQPPKAEAEARVVLAAEKVEALADSTMPIDDSTTADMNNYLISPKDVLNVYDGDTFFVRLPSCEKEMPFLCKRMGVRIEGMDTPERKGLCEDEKKQAALASIKLEVMLRSAKRIELVNVRREKYGRLLGGLMIDGQDVVEEMVLSGMARPYHGEARKGWCEIAAK
jgi:endonuclease YncB( thermonuclease family)